MRLHIILTYLSCLPSHLYTFILSGASESQGDPGAASPQPTHESDDTDNGAESGDTRPAVAVPDDDSASDADPVRLQR